MKRISILTGMAILLFSTLLWGADRIHIDIQARQFKKLNVAVPSFVGPPDLVASVWDICSKDLAVSGVFSLIDPQSYIDQGPMKEIGAGTLKDWILIGADYVIAGQVDRQGATVSFSVQVVELSTAKILLNTVYTTNADSVYRGVHAFMDAFIGKAVGIEGMFSSKIISIQKKGTKKQLYGSWCDGTGGKAIQGGGDLVLNPAWSPDGKKIAFVSYWRNNPDLYILDLSTYKVGTVSNEKGINSTPCFDRTGDKIACTLSIDGNPEIYMLDLKKKNHLRLTNSWATDTSPSLAPDGRSLVFCSSRAGTPQIYVLDIPSKKVERITFAGTYNTEPVFSPNGDLIAFTHLAQDRRFHIAIIRVDGSRMSVLKGTGAGDESPTFSPDGRLIAFACSDGNIYITDIFDTMSVRITTGGGFTEPSWSSVIR
ncbi:MAG: PD40 domain-containing protein [Deltaproteobacteria bacterium]|nr:PD40 domain-containing protein [Deltaproteobacteria bacterium]